MLELDFWIQGEGRSEERACLVRISPARPVCTARVCGLAAAPEFEWKGRPENPTLLWIGIDDGCDSSNSNRISVNPRARFAHAVRRIAAQAGVP
jgi:hypothetical protein